MLLLFLSFAGWVVVVVHVSRRSWYFILGADCFRVHVIAFIFVHFDADLSLYGNSGLVTSFLSIIAIVVIVIINVVHVLIGTYAQ